MAIDLSKHPGLRRKVNAQAVKERKAKAVKPDTPDPFADGYRLERDLVRDALALLRSLGIFAWRNNSGAAGKGKGFVRFGLKGSADILGVLAPSGRFLAIECKAKRKGTSIEQETFLKQVRASGGVAGVCWTLGNVRRLIDAANSHWLCDCAD
jgi:hypothetical protein